MSESEVREIPRKPHEVHNCQLLKIKFKEKNLATRGQKTHLCVETKMRIIYHFLSETNKDQKNNSMIASNN